VYYTAKAYLEILATQIKPLFQFVTSSFSQHGDIYYLTKRFLNKNLFGTVLAKYLHERPARLRPGRARNANIPIGG
jgi:hypothetical protein